MIDKNLLKCITNLVNYKHNSKESIFLKANKNDITLIQFQDNISVIQNEEGINLWGIKSEKLYNENEVDVSYATHQLFVIKTELNQKETEQELIYPFLSSLRLAQQNIDTIIFDNNKHYSDKIIVVLLIEISDSDDKERIKQLFSYFENGKEKSIENLFIFVNDLKSQEKHYVDLWDRLKRNNFNSKKSVAYGNIFPLLPITLKNNKKNYNFKTIAFEELISISSTESFLTEAYQRLFISVQNILLEDVALKKEFAERSKSLNDFAKIIWLKLIIDATNKQNSKTLHSAKKQIFLDTYYVSIEYADGVCELLENSIKHSNGEVGFLYFRNYYVDKNVAPSSAIHNAKFREFINKKYAISGNDIFESSKYLIEFNIIDYAIPIKDEKVFTKNELKHFYKTKVSGMVDKFNETNNTNITQIREIFEYTTNKTDEIAHHLGLKLFEQLIKGNDGIFQVQSPIRDNISNNEIYRSHEYKNRIKILKTKIRGFTQFSIVIPIKYNNNNKNKNKFTFNCNFDVDYSVFSEKEIWTNSININHILNIVNSKNLLRKEKKVNDIYKNLKEEIDSDINNIKISLLVYNVTSDFVYECELIAKAILLLQNNLHEEKKDKVLAIVFYCEKSLILSNLLYDIAISLFIRIYASFYMKSKENLECIKNVPLGVFVTSEDDNVHYVMNICGKNSFDFYSIAEHYIYSGNYYSMKQANQLRKLLSKNNESQKDKLINKINIFPFDLFVDSNIKNIISNNKKNCDNFTKNSASVFIETIKQNLNNELTTAKIDKNYDNGVCIKNTHVTLSSGIHIDKFYQAELLFYNNDAIKKFAILIVRDIIKELEKNDSYSIKIQNGAIIIGYENYSHVLTEQITYYLNEYFKMKSLNYSLCGKSDWPMCIYGTYAGQIDEINGIKTRVVPKLRMQYLAINDSIRNYINLFETIDNNNAPLIIIVEPIGTTLNTILQIRDAVKINKDINFASLNYCLLISAPYNYKGEDTNWQGLQIRSKYCSESCEHLMQTKNNCLKKNECDKKQCIKETLPNLHNIFGAIEIDNKNDEIQKVKYLLHMDCDWYKPNECPLCEKDVVLDWVNKTSTNTYLIHETINNNKKGITYSINKSQSYKIENDKRLEFLRGNIVYGHTKTQANHFLYNLDMKHMLENNVVKIVNGKDKLTCHEDVERWLKTLELNTSAFNILVSPLHKRNSPFVRIVAEYALKQNIRFIHFDTILTPRETMRTNFIHVAKEIALILNDNINHRINVYYCDDSNVSGESINRAKLFVKMLLNEVETENIYDRVDIFKGLIFLVNRSSFETLQLFVKDPIEDVFSYINLAVPNYNTHQGICYDCNFIKKLELEKKRTVSSEDIVDIDRQIKKHRLVTVQQFWEIIKSELFISPKYVKWFKSWMFINFDAKIPSNIKSVLNSLVELTSERIEKINKLISNSEENMHEEINKLIDKINNVCFEDLIAKVKEKIKKPESNDKKIREEIWTFMKNRVIADRYFLRLICTHKLYCKLENISANKKNEEEVYLITLQEILELLYDEKTKLKIKYEKKSHNSNYKQYFLVDFCEILISYIKIMSREQLVRFYHIRQAVIDILIFFYISIVEGIESAKKNLINTGRINASNVNIINLFEEILKDMFFERYDNVLKTKGQEKKYDNRNLNNSLNAGTQAFLLLSLVKRIANLDSSFLLRKGNGDVNSFVNLWKNQLNKYLGIKEYEYFYNKESKKEMQSLITMPSFRYCINIYQNALRWTLLTTSDEGKSYYINKLSYEGIDDAK